MIIYMPQTVALIQSMEVSPLRDELHEKLQGKLELIQVDDLEYFRLKED